MNYYLLASVLVLLFALSLGYWFFFVRASYDGGYVVIKEQRFEVDVALTMKQQAQGLSYRESLGERSGMIFVYKNPTIPSFWMKDMNFPIDIIWIRENKVIGFVEGADPAGYSKFEIFKPESEIDMVLEVNSGVVKDLGIKIGEEIEVVL